MSEFESLSDSEWLEISSNQESDNDSLSSRDSDRDDLPSEPPSRRSSISLGSSVDGEIDAWEGLVDETDVPVVGADPVVATFAATEHAEPRRMLDNQGRVSEEQFVTAALEQSLVGTLSASRSSSLGVSSTVHNSLRDLRLSFPDPLTSSRDELNRSYETVPSPETNCIMDDDPTSPMTTAFPGDDAAPPSEESLPKDESSGPNLETLSDSVALPVRRWADNQINGFDIVLYPSTPQSRDFARWILSILATGGESSESRGSRLRSLSDVGMIHAANDSSVQILNGRPSLAIIRLPHLSRQPSSEHTLYLPVVFPANGSPQAAHKEWSSLNIPAARTARLIKDSESHLVIDGLKMRKQADPKFIFGELEPFLASSFSPSPTKKVPTILEHLRPVHAVTFVALLSLIMGFAVNTAFRSPHLVPASTIVALSPAPTPSTFWGMFATAPNSSVAPLPTASTTTNMAVMPSTLKDFALAVFNPATTPAIQAASISVAPSPPAPCAPGATGSPVEDCKPMAWTEKAKSTKDIIVRPPTALSIPPAAEAPATHTPSVSGSMAKVVALPVAESAPVTSLSLKIGDSLSEIADIAMKALEEVVAHDFRELKNALDALMRAIGHQTTMILEESKSRAQVLRERLHYRNERAKGKARELKRMGEQFVSSAGERFRARAEIAKTRAQSLKKSLMSTSMWRTYAEAHGEWAERLAAKKSRRWSEKRERKVGLFAKLKEKRENRKKRAVT